MRASISYSLLPHASWATAPASLAGLGPMRSAWHRTHAASAAAWRVAAPPSAVHANRAGVGDEWETRGGGRRVS